MKRSAGIVFLSFSFFIFVSACDDQPTEGLGAAAQVAGGAETNYESWRGVVSVLAEDISFTSATLIHPRVVLTAGHGVKQHSGQKDFDYTENPTAIKILGGSDVFSFEGLLLSDAQEIVVHPTWEGVLGEDAVDLALILLEDSLDDKGFYCVAKSSTTEAMAPGDEGLVVGYGLVDNSPEYTAGIHRWGQTTILDIDSTYITIGGPTSVCPGDSGGPLFIKNHEESWVVAGVTSRYSGNCTADGEGYETNLHDHRDWIANIVADLTGDTLGQCTNCGPDGFDCPAPPDTDNETDAGAETDASDNADQSADCDCSIGPSKSRGTISLLLWSLI